MRLVVDTNVLVSAFLWKGPPGRLIELAGSREVRLFTSPILVAELAEVLQRGKFARNVPATGLTPLQMIRRYRRLATVVAIRRPVVPTSPDPDDDAVLACGLAARADLIVSGDKRHLLILKAFEGIPIVTPAEALRRINADRAHRTVRE